MSSSLNTPDTWFRPYRCMDHAMIASSPTRPTQTNALPVTRRPPGGVHRVRVRTTRPWRNGARTRSSTHPNSTAANLDLSQGRDRQKRSASPGAVRAAVAFDHGHAPSGGSCWRSAGRSISNDVRSLRCTVAVYDEVRVMIRTIVSSPGWTGRSMLCSSSVHRLDVTTRQRPKISPMDDLNSTSTDSPTRIMRCEAPEREQRPRGTTRPWWQSRSRAFDVV
jgi:hypothetical protein